jgi:glycerate dehydrogenase
MKIVFLDRDTLSPQTRLREPAFEHEMVCHGRTSAAEAAKRIADADIVLVNKVRLDARALAAAPRLKLIALAATGTDNVDLAVCRERGIVVSNIRNYAVNTVPSTRSR